MKSSEKKLTLDQDSVSSNGFHVGIELELRIAGDEDGHDDDACSDSYRENLESQGAVQVLRDYFSVPRHDASNLETYFDFDQWVSDQCDNHSCDGDCSFMGGDSDSARDMLESDLKDLVKNESIKVVDDSSINTNSGQTAAEVCWNYFASKETLLDNTKILAKLNEIGASFDKSCGLHINLNNYLAIPEISIPTDELSFLFDFVAPSRRTSNYCNRFAMNHEEKYSMIYNQGDRLEFRFFSPTLEVTKLNHYVTLANTVYRRLAGKNAKLPKKTVDYFVNKMTALNGLSVERAKLSIERVNGILSAVSYAKQQKTMSEDDFDKQVTAPSAIQLDLETTGPVMSYNTAATQLFNNINAIMTDLNTVDTIENDSDEDEVA